MPPRLSFTGCTWTSPAVPDDRVNAIRSRTGLSPTAARCAAIRWGGSTPSGWLSPSLDHLHAPLDMMNMGRAVHRLRAAVERRERVRIITDYDVDGTTSSLILQATLRTLAPDIQLDYHIPDRFTDGYGFSANAASKAADDGVQLILTADIGVRDHAAVDAARARGLDVLICDHHLPAGAAVPGGATVLCPPQSGCSYPNRHLAACGVSFKLAQALLGDHPKRDAIFSSLLKLAAIGTVADLVPITTLENRAIVAHGLDQLNRGSHQAGLRALLEVSGLEDGVTESDLGFRIGPRINAAGRVAHAALVIDLLTCRDLDKARALAAHLDALNTERRTIQKKLADEALERLVHNDEPFVVVAGPEEEGWHRGVVGIVASRLKDELHRPVAVVSVQGPVAVGSVRSTTGVHAVRALDAAADLLVKYGGHPAAAGFTVPTELLPELQRRLNRFVLENVPDMNLSPDREIDCEVTADRLVDSLHQELAQLGPFGMGNPEPRLMIPSVRPERPEVLGKNRSVLKFRIPRAGGRAVEAVWFGRPEMLERLHAPVDLLGTLSEHRWNGSRRLQLQVTDARAATP